MIWKRFLSKDEIEKRARVAEDVLFGRLSGSDVEAIGKIAELTTALCNNDCEAAMDGGIFVFFKVEVEPSKFQIFHKRLTVRERALLSSKPSLLQDPSRLLEKFDEVAGLHAEKAAEFRKLADKP